LTMFRQTPLGRDGSLGSIRDWLLRLGALAAREGVNVLENGPALQSRMFLLRLAPSCRAGQQTHPWLILPLDSLGLT
jgi:hypothetical protein